MAQKSYSVVIERDTEGLYVATVPQLAGCHSQAPSLDEVMARITEAIELCLQDDRDSDDGTQFVGIQQVAL